MKKIVSLLCIFAMMFSVVATVNAAADNSVYLTYAIDGDTLTLDVNIKGAGYFTASTYYDVKALVDAGASFKSSQNFVSTSNVANFKNNMLATNGNWPDVQNGEFKMATYVFDIANVEAGSITIAPAAETSRTKFSVADKATNKLNFTQETLTIVIEGDAPAVEWIPVSASVVELTGDDPEAVDYAYGINTTCPGAVQMIFAADVDGARKYSQEFSAEGTEGSVNYGFYAGTTQYGNVSVLFRDAAEKEDTTKIWYSNALDLANKE